MRAHTAAACVAALFLASCVFGHTVALRLLLLAAGIVLAAFVLSRTDGIRALPPVWIPFLLWGAWALASLAWSMEPERTLKEWRNEVFYTGAALWICFVGAQARDAVRIFLPVLGAAAVGACAIALYEFGRGWEHYLVGWHSGPGDHSSALLVLMPCAAMTLWYGVRARWRPWILACIVGLAPLFFASAYTTLNRTIWLGFAVQFLLFGFFALRRAEAKGIATAITVAVIAGCGAIMLSIQAERAATMAAKSFEHDPRLTLWPRIVQHVQDRPATGYGFGRGLLRDSLQQEFRSLDEQLWHAHNIVLDTLIQLGVPGAFLLALLLGAVLREGWRLARSTDEAVAACGIALIAVVAGTLVRNMTDSLLARQNALLFWGVIGVLLALGARSGQARSTARIAT
jgi:O-antigen ligase